MLPRRVPGKKTTTEKRETRYRPATHSESPATKVTNSSGFCCIPRRVYSFWFSFFCCEDFVNNGMFKRRERCNPTNLIFLLSMRYFPSFAFSLFFLFCSFTLTACPCKIISKNVVGCFCSCSSGENYHPAATTAKVELEVVTQTVSGEIGTDTTE